MLELDRVEKAGNAEAKKTVNKKRMEKQGLLDKAESRVTECKEQAGTKSKNLNDAEVIIVVMAAYKGVFSWLRFSLTIQPSKETILR